MCGCSVDDIRNEMGGTPYKDPKWHNLFPGPEELAKGRWSTPEDDPSAASGFRRYGASKLCATMLQYVDKTASNAEPPHT